MQSCLSMSNTKLCYAEEVEVSEVKERPSPLPTRSPVHRNSTDRGGSEMFIHYKHVSLHPETILWMQTILCIIKRTPADRRFVLE